MANVVKTVNISRPPVSGSLTLLGIMIIIAAIVIAKPVYADVVWGWLMLTIMVFLVLGIVALLISAIAFAYIRRPRKKGDVFGQEY